MKPFRSGRRCDGALCPGFCHCSSPDALEAQKAVGTGLSWEPRAATGAGSQATVILWPSYLPVGRVGHGGVVRSSQPLTSHSHLPKGKHRQLPGQGRNQAGEELQPKSAYSAELLKFRVTPPMFIKLPRHGQSALTSSHDPEEGPGPVLKGTTVQASLAPGCRRPWVRALGFLIG